MSELFGFEGLGMFVCIDDLPRDFATALRVEVEVDAIGFFFVEACGGNLLRETSFSLSASPKIGLYASTSECPGPGDNGFQSGSEARDFSWTSALTLPFPLRFGDERIVGRGRG